MDGKWTGTYLVNDADLIANSLPAGHTINLPTIGTGNTTTTSAGATIVMLWRKADEPLRKIVMSDGAAIQAQGTITTHTLAGFYKAASASPAKLTYVVGTGADNPNERVFFNGAVVGTNSFIRPIGAGSDRGWSNPTFNITPQQMANLPVDPNFGQVVTTRSITGRTRKPPRRTSASPWPRSFSARRSRMGTTTGCPTASKRRRVG